MSNLNTGSFPVKTYRNLDAQIAGSLVKASKVAVFSGYVYNNNAAVRYLKLYDKATAPLSTDTPVATIPVAPTSGVTLDLSEAGAEFLLGLGIRGTTGVADADVGAPAANDLVVNLFYL